MFGKLKISILALAGMTLTLGACNTPPNPSPQATPPAANETPQLNPPQANQNAPVATSIDRAKYKLIQLKDISSSSPLKGKDPKEVALKAFGNVQSEGGSQDVRVNYPQPNKAVVTITQLGVADASVGGIQYRAEFSSTPQSTQSSPQWEMVWAGSQVKCRPGRGHQDWSTENCQ